MRWRKGSGANSSRMRGKTAMTMLSADDGIDRALAVRAQKPGKPVVIADVWDNPGGGVAGDGT